MAKIVGHLKYRSANGLRIKLPLTDEFAYLDMPGNYPPVELSEAYLVNRDGTRVKIEGYDFKFKYKVKKKRK